MQMLLGHFYLTYNKQIAKLVYCFPPSFRPYRGYIVGESKKPIMLWTNRGRFSPNYRSNQDFIGGPYKTLKKANKGLDKTEKKQQAFREKYFSEYKKFIKNEL